MHRLRGEASDPTLAVFFYGWFPIHQVDLFRARKLLDLAVSCDRRRRVPQVPPRPRGAGGLDVAPRLCRHARRRPLRAAVGRPVGGLLQGRRHRPHEVADVVARV